MILETRVCACGCKRTFRVVPSSPNTFALESHARDCANDPNPDIQAKAREFLSYLAKKRPRSSVPRYPMKKIHALSDEASDDSPDATVEFPPEQD